MLELRITDKDGQNVIEPTFHATWVECIRFANNFTYGPNGKVVSKTLILEVEGE